MRGINLQASRVHQVATRFLESKSITQEPSWYNIIAKYPPGEFLTRTKPIQHCMTQIRSKKRKPSKMFRPQRIEYEEDKFRREFYQDHPWELARPRIVLETDGKDSHEYDWSKMDQPNKPLDGESVVQRRLWLLENVPEMTISLSYDVARKEFYDLRHTEEIERRITREEALWYGAQFGPGPIEWGMQLEDKAYESWRTWALKNLEELELKKEASLYHDISDIKAPSTDELGTSLDT